MAAAAPRYEEWVSEATVDELSARFGEPPEVRADRREAFRGFTELPLEPDPLYRKYGYFSGVDLSGIEPLARGAPVRVPPTAPDTVQLLHDAAGTRATVPEGLTAKGVRVVPFPELLEDAGVTKAFLNGTEPRADRLTGLGLALLNRGYRLEVPDGLDVAVRVQDVTVLSDARAALSVRRSIRAGVGARLLVSEEVYTTGGDGHRQRLYGSSTDLELAPRAHAAYLTVHAPDLATVSIYTRTSRVGDAARLGWVWAGFGGHRTRLRNHTRLPGHGSEVEDLQTFYGAHEQAYDSSVRITHEGTDTRGQSVTRGVYKDTARGMSRGLVRIEKEARKTVSYLSEHAMLLSKGARSDTIPILEILCRDVKATHSTSVAPVDPEKVFYLASRGFRESDAIRMIGEGFLAHVLEQAPFLGLRESLYPFLAARWEGRPVDWSHAGTVGLPPLEFRGTGATTDWRFDTKLR